LATLTLDGTRKEEKEDSEGMRVGRVGSGTGRIRVVVWDWMLLADNADTEGDGGGGNEEKR